VLPPNTQTMQLSVVTELQDFHALKDEWNTLLYHSGSNVIFLKWEWLYNWWLVYGTGLNKLCILTVRDHERLLGIAPLYIHRGGIFFQKEIRFLGTNVACSDHMDLILYSGMEKEVTLLMLSYLNERDDLWDTMRLTDIPRGSNTLTFIASSFQDKPMKIDETHTTCPYLKLSLPWEKVYESYSSVIKNSLARKLKKFERVYKGEIIEVGSDEDLNPYLDKLLFLNTRRMKKKKLRSSFLQPHFVDFHRKIIKSLRETNEVKFIFLKVGNDLIAGIYLFTDHRRYYYYQSGFDPEWEKLSPGTLLFNYAIRDAHKHGKEEFDFLQGNEEYKYLWTQSYRHNTRISIYRRSALLRIVRHFENGKSRVRSWLP